jgi:hippurate hydrolase
MLDPEAWRYFTALRHDLHRIPELAYHEHKTADRIARELELLSVPYERGVGTTGIVAWIRKGTSARAIALRADIDALPIAEESGAAYASEHPGIMHACGHDGHTVMLLAAAKILKEKIDFDGTVYLIFQPAEEGGAGAKAMLDDGILERYPFERIYGLHNRPGEPLGTLWVKAGPVMTSVDTWRIVVQGRSGHSSQPHRTINPIAVASHIVLAIKEISSLDIDPAEAHVVSVARIESGIAFNVVPEVCTIEGSIRAFSETVQEQIEERLRTIAEGIAAGFGAQASIEYRRRYPPTINTHIEQAYAAAVRTVGEAYVRDDFPSSMGSEDFSFFLRQREGCYVWLGTQADPEAETIPLHSSRYDFDDRALSIGAAYWVHLVEEELGTRSGV